jgi:hypothetical protein
VQKIAPFTEYDDKQGNTLVVANRTSHLVGSTNGLHKTAPYLYGELPVVTFTQHGMFMHLEFADGMAMGFPVHAERRKVFSNRFV